MELLHAIKTCFSKYADFTGRAPRSEYWWFVLFVFVLAIVFTLIDPARAFIFHLGVLLPQLAGRRAAAARHRPRRLVAADRPRAAGRPDRADRLVLSEERSERQRLWPAAAAARGTRRGDVSARIFTL